LYKSSNIGGEKDIHVATSITRNKKITEEQKRSRRAYFSLQQCQGVIKLGNGAISVKERRERLIVGNIRRESIHAADHIDMFVSYPRVYEE
jgi:hypothetical protein